MRDVAAAARVQAREHISESRLSRMKPLSSTNTASGRPRRLLIVDEEGGDVEPTRRYTTWLAAAARLTEIIDEDVEATPTGADAGARR